MLRLASPLYLLLLIPLVAAAWCMYARRVRSALAFSLAGRLRDLSGTSVRLVISRLTPLLVLLGLASMVVALSRPQTVFSKSRRTSDVLAMEMVVDISGSMKALDMSDIAAGRIIKERTRLDAVKTTFGEFLETRTDDLVGLVTFGGYATTRCPLTTDHGALRHVLTGVEVPGTEQAGDGSIVNQEELLTAIGDALATACARLERAEPTSRVVVLLSDGESNTGIIEPDEATEVAKKLGIKVYTIGVGSTGRAPFRDRDMFGREQISYSRVALDEALLKRIASETGGRYFNVRDPEGLAASLEDIGRLETTRIERDTYHQYNELFAWFLMPGLLLFTLGVALQAVTTRRLI